MLNQSLTVLKANGFVLSRETLDYDSSQLNHHNLVILTIHRTPTETLVLLQKQGKVKPTDYIKINSDDLSWIRQVQEALNKNNDQVLYAENQHDNGILGFINCLRKESPTSGIRCVYVMDGGVEFRPSNSLFADQLRKNMAVNVYKNGQWGTYRILPLNQKIVVEREHCFINAAIEGVCPNVEWVEGPLGYDMTSPSEKTLIHVYYAAINDQDLLMACGKTTQNRSGDGCTAMAFEFSGRDKRGQRVMGVVSGGALSTMALTDPYLTFRVPDSWSMEEAATVPFIYTNLLYTLVIVGQIKRGETILIHSGAGEFGQAAIRLSLYYGGSVYATADNLNECRILQNTFPNLTDNRIVNSLDESLEQTIYQATNGRGVDIVLKFLPKGNTTTSLRCLAQNGRFLQLMGHQNTSSIDLLSFKKEASFHSITADHLFKETPYAKAEIVKLFATALKDGAVRPLSRNVFKYDEIEQAFRFASTNHLGKVLVKVREPEQQFDVSPSVRKFAGAVRYYCDPEKTYIIVGGLGGFGLELADWLVSRGANKLVLSSRKGITNGYQEKRIRTWKSYGVQVKLPTDLVTTRIGCRRLIEESLQLGRIEAIFNLAVVIEDAFFENQTPDRFYASLAPKAIATRYFDELTREMCPDLKQFVVFSSLSCGWGNEGQTNYGMANSVMERICEKRKQDGYPALAIEWGPVGEVGLVAERTKITEMFGTVLQKISSCLQHMDIFLRQEEATIVSSFVAAEKRRENTTRNIVDAVINSLGLKDAKSISLRSSLSELGLDSVTATEIRQMLGKEFDVSLSPNEIRTISLLRLKEIQEEKHEMETSD